MVRRSLHKIPHPAKRNQVPQKPRWKKQLPLIATIALAALVISVGNPRLGTSPPNPAPEPGGKPVLQRVGKEPNKEEGKREVKYLKFLLKKRKQLQEAKRRLSPDSSQDEFNLWKRDLALKSPEELNMEWCYQTWRIMHPSECAPGQSDCEGGQEDAQAPWSMREAVEEEMLKRWGEGERPEEREKTRAERNWAAALKERTDSEIEYFMDGELRVVLQSIDYYNLAIKVGNEFAEADALEYSEEASWRLKALMHEANSRGLI
jgi:hypothetical protein